MHTLPRVRLLSLIAVVAVTTFSVSGQSFYRVGKGQAFVQTSSAGAVPDPGASFGFGAGAATSATLALPSGSTVTLPRTDNSDAAFGIDQGFATKAALDAAYPNGTYRMTGPGIPTLTFNMTTETYPAATPQVTGGNWNAGGLLVVDPAQNTVINFSNFATYATAGVAGHMEFNFNGVSDTVELSQQATSVSVFGGAAVPTPFTSFTIPAGRLTSGRIYEAELSYQTGTTLDSTTLPGSLIAALWSKDLTFYVAAQAPGTTTPPPVIVAQPANQTGPLGGRVTFNVGFTFGGAQPGPNSSFIVDWFFNGQRIRVDGTKYSFGPNGFSVANLTAADAGSYSARIINAGGIVTSNAATLTIGGGGGALAINRQPVSQTVAQGSSVVFSVGATLPQGPVTYDWKFNGTSVSTAVTGAGGPIIVLQNANASVAGNYSVTITAGTAQVTSDVATLTVAQATADPGRLINLSILTVLTLNESMTMGTVIGGSGTSGTKPLLARAAGPSLAQLGVTNFLLDPTMTLLNTSANPAVTVATNNDWGGTAALIAAFTSVGAFPYTATSSKDAAVFQSALAPGNYTVQVNDTGIGVGTVIAELYDGTPAGTFTATTPRLINVSVLKQIQAGGSLTAGFVIGGSTAKSVLIRAIGPTLGQAPFNIGGVMADPQLTLTNTSANPNVVVAANNDWGGLPAIVTVSSRVGAFAVGNLQSRDAMILVTLAPGNYTAQVSPVAGTGGGTAIVEVYEVP